MHYVVWALVLLLVVLHQDVWFWKDSRLVFGFIPIGLMYHACLSMAASVVWFLAVQFAWPTGLEEEVLAAVDEVPAGQGGSEG